MCYIPALLQIKQSSRLVAVETQLNHYLAIILCFQCVEIAYYIVYSMSLLKDVIPEALHILDNL